MHLRRLQPTDPDLADIAAQLNAADSEVSVKKFSAESLQRFLASSQAFYLIATIDGQVAGAIHGYCLQHPAGPKYLYIDEVDTVAQYRRRGVAKAMMQETFAIGRQYGADEAWLGTEDDNDAANALYQGLAPSETEHGPIYTYKLDDHGPKS
jgi:aminoglycoside 6'-N-acetyltransferase I